LAPPVSEYTGQPLYPEQAAWLLNQCIWLYKNKKNKKAEEKLTEL